MYNIRKSQEYQELIRTCISITISRLFHVEISLVSSKSRQQELVDLRRMIVMWCRMNTNMITKDIGSIINLDHSTVVHCTKVNRDEIKIGNKKYSEYLKFHNYMIGLLDNTTIPMISYSQSDAIPIILPDDKFIKVDLCKRYVRASLYKYSNLLRGHKGSVINESLIDKINEEYANRYCNGKSS